MIEHVDAWRARRWKWGVSDCCTFAADWVLSQTGADPMADLRGTYSSRMSAESVIAEHGGLKALLGRARDLHGPLPNAAVLTFHNGVQVAALVNGRFAHWFTVTGVGSVRTDWPLVERFD